jgi:hypothetical protein
MTSPYDCSCDHSAACDPQWYDRTRNADANYRPAASLETRLKLWAQDARRARESFDKEYMT